MDVSPLLIFFPPPPLPTHRDNGIIPHIRAEDFIYILTPVRTKMYPLKKYFCHKKEYRQCILFYVVKNPKLFYN